LPLAQTNFADLFREHYARVYRYVRYRVDDDMTAEDLTAEIFERAYRYRDRYDASRGSFSTWITSIAHNWVNNFLVAQSRRDQNELIPNDDMETTDIATSADVSPEAQAITSERIRRLLLCLDRLSARDRQVIALRFASDMRNKEIAELLGMKEHTVSVVVLRALDKLKACQEEA
jgi:RNA polymerase sigma factor (sigma-70 family)